MTDKAPRVGARINDEDGALIVRVGSELLDEHLDLAQQIGRFATAWAQTEAELGGYLAALLRTDPDRTFALLSRFGSAKAYADAAKDLITASIEEPQRTVALDFVKQFRSLAEERNAVQHCLWAAKPSHPGSLFRLKASEWSMFAIRLAHAASQSTEDAIILAEELAARISDEYTIARLDALVERAHTLSAELFKLKSTELQASHPALTGER